MKRIIQNKCRQTNNLKMNTTVNNSVDYTSVTIQFLKYT